MSKILEEIYNNNNNSNNNFIRCINAKNSSYYNIRKQINKYDINARVL